MSYPYTVIVTSASDIGYGFRWTCGCGDGAWHEDERQCRNEGAAHQREHTEAYKREHPELDPEPEPEPDLKPFVAPSMTYDWDDPVAVVLARAFGCTESPHNAVQSHFRCPIDGPGCGAWKKARDAIAALWANGMMVVGRIPRRRAR